MTKEQIIEFFKKQREKRLAEKNAAKTQGEAPANAVEAPVAEAEAAAVPEDIIPEVVPAAVDTIVPAPVESVAVKKTRKTRKKKAE